MNSSVRTTMRCKMIISFSHLVTPFLKLIFCIFILVRFHPFLCSIFIDNIQANWFSSLEKLRCLDVLNNSLLKAGEREMKKHSVIIAGICRDNAYELPTAIRYIELTGKYFRDFRVLIVENDSSDDTQLILGAWKAQNSRVKIIQKHYWNRKRPNIAFLATVRNHYLSEMAAHGDYTPFDMVMIVDMDMTNGWDMRGVLHSFSEIGHWDAVCSNGVFTPRGHMWDMFAFRSAQFPENNSHPHYWSKIAPAGQVAYPVGAALMPVYSCFGGLAFYKKSFFNRCRYASYHDDCEHVAFHRCLRRRRARIVMNPSQVVRYFHYKYFHLAKYIIVIVLLMLLVVSRTRKTYRVV